MRAERAKGRFGFGLAGGKRGIERGEAVYLGIRAGCARRDSLTPCLVELTFRDQRHVLVRYGSPSHAAALASPAEAAIAGFARRGSSSTAGSGRLSSSRHRPIIMYPQGSRR